jgi:hypothetical protein
MTDKPDLTRLTNLTRYTIIYRVTLPGGAHSTAKNGIELDRLVTDALKRGLKPEIEVLT